MADEKEKVLYEFQGDVSSLRKSTNDAIAMLDKFQDNMDKLNAEGIVKASQRAQSGFQSSVNKMTKGINAVQKKLNSVGDVRMPQNTEAFAATDKMVNSLVGTLNKLNSSNTITTKSLNSMKAELNAATAGLKEAGPSFDKLITKEEKFQKRLETIGTVASRFGTAFHGATKKVHDAFTSMGTSISTRMSSIGNLFEPLKAKIQGFKDNATIAGNRVAQVFSTVADALRRTSDGTDGAAASQKRLGKTLDGISVKQSKNNKEIEDASGGYDEMGAAASAALGSSTAWLDIVSNALGAVKNLVGGIVDSFFALAGVEVGDLLADGAKSAIDFVENLNLFQVAMGSSIDKGTAFVNKMQELYGMDPSNIYRYTGYFYQLTDAIGMSADASASLSLSMTKAANDLASLFNQDIATVVDDLSSGMMGMSRSVRKYGMDIRVTTLQQTAFKYGLTEQVETMSEANRQALRYITMLEQAQNALKQTTNSVDGSTESMGDFARNIETPANQLRIFKEQMSQLGRAIGNFIVAPLADALPYINGFVMALRTLVTFLSRLLGVATQSGNSLSSAGESAEDAASGVGSVGGAADKAAKKLKQLIAPFDELNVLQESAADSGGGSGSLFASDALDPTLAAALEDMELNLENIKMKANSVRDSILNFLGLKVTSDPITGEQIIQWDKESFKTNVMDGLNQFKSWLEETPAIVGVFATAILGLGYVLSTPYGAVVALYGALATLLAFSEPFRTAFVGVFTTIGEAFSKWGQTLFGVFSTIGTGVLDMWETHIRPTIDSIGSMLAPALETLGGLWENVSVIIDDAFSLVGDLWTTFLQPTLEDVMELIQDLAGIIQDLYEKYLGPVIDGIGDDTEGLWTDTLKPIIDKVITILRKVMEVVFALWNNPLKPIVEWLVGVLGPIIKNVFTQVWNVIKQVIEDIGDVIEGLLQVLEGVIDFLVGVFTGDWERAWKGLVNIFVGIGNLIIGVFELVVNAIISLINTLIEVIWQAIQALVNIVLGAVEGIAEFLGKDLDIRFNASVAEIPSISIPRIPQMATGGVVTGPTHLIAGEGKYSEAILPLEDSPQMQDLINKIAEAVDKDDNPNPQPVEVKVYIGGKEYDAYTYKAAERGKKIVGKQPVKIGG